MTDPNTTVLAPLTWHKSPNFSLRNGRAVTHLVWHATVGHYQPSINWLCTPTIHNPDGSVRSGPDASCHLMVNEVGSANAQLVELAKKAWHCETWNAWTVGVEHASLGPSFYTHAQFLESARLFAYLCDLYGIPPIHGIGRPRGIVRHRDLGAAGGGHVDGPSDFVWFNQFLPAVHHELTVGGFRDVYAR